MGWIDKASWPVVGRDEISYAHFEDLRKRMFSIDWIMLPEWYWNDLLDYYEGDVVFWKGQEWICISDEPPWWEEPDASSSWDEYPQDWNSKTTYPNFSRVLFASGQGVPIWEVEKYYSLEMLVRKGVAVDPVDAKDDIYYRCKLNHTSDLGENALQNLDLWYEVEIPKYEYTLGAPSSKGWPPPHNQWWRTARRDVYSDYNRNSGCWIIDWEYDIASRIYTIKDLWPAYLEYPPQFNKYTQGIRWAGGFPIPNEVLYGSARSMEQPVELGLRLPSDNWGDRAMIGGPIGAQYVEMHPPHEGWTWAPPWYHPYRIYTSNIPYIDSGYYEKKMQGYQSFIEWFTEKWGGEFYWHLEGDALAKAIDEGHDTMYVLRDNSVWSMWDCNRSAFEKCLEIIGSYDWYLDLNYPPDPEMYRLTNPNHLIKGCWRRCWRYSFGPPNGLIWPQEKGDPPFINEDRNWWKNKDNVAKVATVALGRLTAEDAKGILERHFPKEIKRPIERQDVTPDEDLPFDYFDEVDKMIETYEKIKKLIDYILAHGGSIVENWREFMGYYNQVTRAGQEGKAELYFEMQDTMINDMKEVLDCLKWIEKSCSQTGGTVQDTYDPKEPPGEGQFANWSAAKAWYGNTNNNDEQTGRGWLGARATGAWFWTGNPPPWFKYTCSLYEVYKKILWTIYGDGIQKYLAHAFYDRVMLCIGFSGVTARAPSPDYFKDTSWWQNVRVSGLNKSISIDSGDTEQVFHWMSFAAEDDGVEINLEIGGSDGFHGNWGAPLASEPHAPTWSDMYGNIGLDFRPEILIGIDVHKVDLGSVLIE